MHTFFKNYSIYFFIIFLSLGLSSEDNSAVNNTESNIYQSCSDLSETSEGSISCSNQPATEKLNTISIIIAKPPVSSRTSIINLGYETSGVGNTGYGEYILASNEGSRNSAFGFTALQTCNNCDFNTAVGWGALRGSSSMTGDYNVAVGNSAIYSNTSGSDNVGIGKEALYSNTMGSYNIGIGSAALRNGTAGQHNIGIGTLALTSLGSTVSGNTIVGSFGGEDTTSGNSNTGMGSHVLNKNTSGDNNVAMGFNAMYSNTSGDNNNVLGRRALYSNTTGNQNIAIGTNAGYASRGDRNVFIGYEAGYSETGSDKLYISNASNSNLLYGNFSSGDLSLGKTSGTVTILNDADIDGTSNPWINIRC